MHSRTYGGYWGNQVQELMGDIGEIKYEIQKRPDSDCTDSYKPVYGGERFTSLKLKHFGVLQ